MPLFRRSAGHRAPFEEIRRQGPPATARAGSSLRDIPYIGGDGRALIQINAGLAGLG